MKPVVHYILEKQKKMTIFYSSALFFGAGLIYVGFKPETLTAYQTFCTSVAALATGFFVAHASQKHSEVKYQANGVSMSVSEEGKDANTTSSSK